jgi:hypothetical protein
MQLMAYKALYDGMVTRGLDALRGERQTRLVCLRLGGALQVESSLPIA